MTTKEIEQNVSEVASQFILDSSNSLRLRIRQRLAKRKAEKAKELESEYAKSEPKSLKKAVAKRKAKKEAEEAKQKLEITKKRVKKELEEGSKDNSLKSKIKKSLARSKANAAKRKAKREEEDYGSFVNLPEGDDNSSLSEEDYGSFVNLSESDNNPLPSELSTSVAEEIEEEGTCINNDNTSLLPNDFKFLSEEKEDEILLPPSMMKGLEASDNLAIDFSELDLKKEKRIDEFDIAPIKEEDKPSPDLFTIIEEEED